MRGCAAALWLCSACVVIALAEDSEGTGSSGEREKPTSFGSRQYQELKDMAKKKFKMESLSKLADKIKSLRSEDKELQHEVLEMAAAMFIGMLVFLCFCCCICCRRKTPSNKPEGHEYEMVKRDDSAFGYDDEDGKMENQIDVSLLLPIGACYTSTRADLSPVASLPAGGSDARRGGLRADFPGHGR